MMRAAGLLFWSVVASLMVLHCRGQVLGDVFLYEAGKGEKEPVHFDPFPDLPADFGPEVPDEGIDGLLFVADPEDACEPLTNRYDDEPWVALISRSQHAHPTNCTFDVKVHNAELAGAAAAIVYDDVYEALIIMSKPRDHEDPGIPAVFVSEKAGIIMRKLMTPGVTRVRIVPVSASAWMSLLMSAFLGFLALTVVLATFYVMRSWSMWLGRTRRRGMAPELAGFGALGAHAGAQEGLPACAIRALPILIYEGKPSKHRRSSTGSIQPAAAADTLEAAGQRALSAPVPIAAPAAGTDNVAWMAGSPAMPETPQALAAGEDARSSQQTGQRRSSAAETAVVLIESDSEGDTSGARRQREQQHNGLSQRLATSSSAVTSGLISLASLAAAGSRRVLLLGGHGSPSSSAPGDPTALAAAAAAAAGHPCGQSSSARSAAAAVDVPGAAAAAAVAGADVAPGSGCATPTGSMSCRSSLYSTDDEDGDLPEVVQSWPGAGGMARVVTGGPVGARGGATRHTCVVCLERYTAGDKIRVLPCQHRFHAKCIDPWLASRRLCPVCKHDASTWPSNSLQAALSGPVPLDTPAQPAAAAASGGGAVNPSLGGVNLLSAPLSAGVVSLAGRGYWFRRLRARLARASRRRQQQQQQEQQQLLAAGGVGSGMGPAHAAAAVAEAAEAGLLQPPPAAVTVDVRQGQQPVLLAQPGSLQQQEPQLQAAQQGENSSHLQQQQQQQQRSQQQRRRGQQQREGGGLQEPLLPAR